MKLASVVTRPMVPRAIGIRKDQTVTLSKSPIHRTEPRYGVLTEHAEQFQLTCQVGGTECPARLTNVSPHGACIVFNQRIEPGSEFILNLLVEQLSLEVQVRATVRWIDVTSAEEWQLGCHFHESIRQSTLDLLCQHGYIERRRTSRFDVGEEILVNGELSGAIGSGWMSNVSNDGLCFSSQDKYHTGELLRIESQEDFSQTTTTCYVRVVWVSDEKNSSNEHSYGCRIVGDSKAGDKPFLNADTVVG